MTTTGSIFDLLLLQADWDSYGARAVSPRAIETALAFLTGLGVHPRPSIVPTTRGGVQLEWSDGRVDVEIECMSHGMAVLLAVDTMCDETTERWVVPGHKSIGAWLARLTPTFGG